MPEITLLDYLLLPFYLWMIYKMAYYYRDRYYPQGHACRPYFIPGLTVKIAGAVFIGMFYNYYYGGGDTFNYLFHSQLINSTFLESPAAWLRLITHQADESNGIDAKALSAMYWYDDPATYTTSCLGAMIGIFCFTKYLVINIFIAVISFTGMWLMFITFVGQYQKLIKYIAIAVLFMPGPVVWGSGLFKDSFCMFSIGCLIYSFYILFEIRKFKIWLILLSLVSIALLALIKAYILVALFPFLLFKIILVYKKRAALNPRKRVAFYIGFSLFLLVGIFVLKKSVVYLTAFSADNVMETVVRQKDYLLQVSLDQDGSAYDLGDFEPSIGGMSRMIVPAVNVALFRPYLWESRSIIQLFNAMESLGVLLLTFYLLFKRNIFKTLKNIYQDPNLILCFFFTLVFAFFVGISSYNFGTLSRYKIPCTPFYMLFLMILIFKDKAEKGFKLQEKN
ncbi:hypothetical protein [Pedobacter sp. L105]|uniref:hypothetical protein n=1 Tax=Pedobacter sp. L105 TaxID=1641871 RepID=UPI00131B9EF5|nr:hypothetical protein [Pedobacter sp. L105]